MTLSQQRLMLCSEATPENPDNIGYLPCIDASSYPSIFVNGKKSPRFGLYTYLKPRTATKGWSNADFFKSHLEVDTTLNTDMFAAAFQDDVDNRVYDFSRCEMVEFDSHASGGACMVRLGYKSRMAEEDGTALYGTTLASGEVIPAAPAFTYSDTPDAGQLTDTTNIVVVGASQVKGFRMTLVRGQVPQYYYDGANVPGIITSTMYSGILTLDQEPDASTVIETTGTVTIKFSNDMTSTTGRFKADIAVKRDNRFRPVVTSLGNVTRTYSIIDPAAGGLPCTFTAF